MDDDKHYLEGELEELVRTDARIWQFIREGSLDGVWYWDLENPEHEYMSPEFWRLFGFDPETKAHLAAEWQDLIFAEDLELAKENVARHIEDPAHPYDQIVRYRRADGDVTWVRCRGLAIRDETGKAVRLLGAHNDVTALKKEELAALEASELFSRVMNTVQSAIIGLNRQGRILSINSAGRHFLGGLNDPLPFDWPSETVFVDKEKFGPLSAAEDPVQRALAGDSHCG